LRNGALTKHQEVYNEHSTRGWFCCIATGCAGRERVRHSAHANTQTDFTATHFATDAGATHRYTDSPHTNTGATDANAGASASND